MNIGTGLTMTSGQSRTVSTRCTVRKSVSSGRCRGSCKVSCNKRWKSKGVSKFLWDSMMFDKTENHLSTSSWEWPDCKNRYSHRLTRWSPVITPPNLKQQLFFTSRLVLSAWHNTSKLRKSWCWATLCNECAMISQLQALSLRTNGNPKAIIRPWPWTMLAVRSRVGLIHPWNSFEENIATLRGHLYFWWSMPSTMRHNVLPLSTIGSRLRARALQYSVRSEYCILRCLPYSATCEARRRLSPANRFIKSLCLVQTAHCACCVSSRNASLFA